MNIIPWNDHIVHLFKNIYTRVKRKNIKDRCQKRNLQKFRGVCKTYDEISYRLADILSEDEEIKEIRCNVPLEGFPEGDYTTDFVCTKDNNELMVRECVYRKHLTKPLTIKLLDASRKFWLERGVIDWKIVVEEEN